MAILGADPAHMKAVIVWSNFWKRELGIGGVLRKTYRNLGRKTILSKLTLPTGDRGRDFQV